MDDVVIDACCMINLYAAGDLRNRLMSLGQKCYVPSAVVVESLFIYDKQADGTTARIPIDLQPLIADAVLHTCDVKDDLELDRYVHLASQIDDGEAMALAIAHTRGWTIASDDRKAIRLATEHSVSVLTTPDVIKKWSDTTNPTPLELQQVVARIETLAAYFPSSRHHLREWWAISAGRT